MQPELMGSAHDGSGINEPNHVPEIELVGNDIAANMRLLGHELKRQRKIVAELLVHVGRKGQCKQCKQPILWVWHIDTSHFVAHNPDGTEHNIANGRRTKHA